MTATRILWMAGAAVALGLGTWGGLARLGWVIPPLMPHHVLAHGPLMIGGFLGALIGLERAVALGRWWAYLVPALAVASTGWMAFRPETGPAAWLLVAASGVAFFVYGELLQRRDDLAMWVMAVGTLAWLAGNLTWATGGMVIAAVPWWGAFLVLTILGERLELSQVVAPPRRSRIFFVAGLAVLVGGLLLSYLDHELGLRAFGLGLAALAAWGLRWDLARRTLRFGGRHRFTALCLLGGYFWMLVSGAMMLIWGGELGGLPWDAALHALFLGFVFSMIFGHAPLVAKSVLGVELPYSPSFYFHLSLLHLSLLLRVGADLAGSTLGRSVGSTLNMVAIAVFLLATLRAGLEESFGKSDRG